jgi:catalase (peroxidase I)
MGPKSYIWEKKFLKKISNLARSNTKSTYNLIDKEDIELKSRLLIQRIEFVLLVSTVWASASTLEVQINVVEQMAPELRNRKLIESQ